MPAHCWERRSINSVTHPVIWLQCQPSRQDTLTCVSSFLFRQIDTPALRAARSPLNSSTQKEEKTCYPLIIWMNSNSNNPSTRKASKVWILKLWETQTSDLATQTTSDSRTCRGRPSLTCSDTVHGIRSPEAFLPRDRLFKMD